MCVQNMVVGNPGLANSCGGTSGFHALPASRPLPFHSADSDYLSAVRFSLSLANKTKWKNRKHFYKYANVADRSAMVSHSDTDDGSEHY